MDVKEAVRELGRAIQQDERFIRYAAARLANDRDEALQSNIGEFNMVRMNLENEMAAETRDEKKINEWNEQLRRIYGQIMATESMMAYNTAKNEVDSLLNDVNSMIAQCVDGADPDTVEPETHTCGGDCAGCGGCH